MKIVDIRETAVPVNSNLRNAVFDFSQMTTSIVAVASSALYLHFNTRAELLIATTHYLDALNKVDERLVPSRAAQTGIERLDAFIEAWGGYIPEI